MRYFLLVLPFCILMGCGAVKEEVAKGVKEGVQQGLTPEAKEQLKPLTDTVQHARETAGQVGQEIGRKAGEAISKGAGNERVQEALKGTADRVDKALPERPESPAATPLPVPESIEARVRALEEKMEKCCAGR